MKKRLTSVLLPPALHARAKRCAKRGGVTFGELVRQAIEKKVREEEGREDDPLFRPAPASLLKGVEYPKDLAQNVDDYLYGGKSL